MKKLVFLATYIGEDNSCGYGHGKEYSLTAIMLKGNIVVVPTEANVLLQDLQYDGMFDLMASWDNIKMQVMGAAPDRELTFGEKAVGITFNPGGSPGVNRIKRMNADLIDLYHDSRTGSNQEKGRMFSEAITCTQTGQMWGVKSDTWQY